MLSESALTHLQQVLNGELELYRQLLRLSQREGFALLDDNLPMLMDIIRSKEHLLKHGKEWEGRREQALQDMQADYNFELPLTLSNLIAQLPPVQAEPLQALYEEFLETTAEIRRLNEQNRLRLEAELTRIHATFNYLSTQLNQVSPENSTYSAEGQNQRQANAAGVVLNRQI